MISSPFLISLANNDSCIAAVLVLTAVVCFVTANWVKFFSKSFTFGPAIRVFVSIPFLITSTTDLLSSLLFLEHLTESNGFFSDLARLT